MGDETVDIKDDLPLAMTMAAFIGISWYIGVEINISLFLLFKRRRGLYFWACALSSWGVVLQPLCIVLGDFGVWARPRAPAIALIYLTWLAMVVPQSWVLYSRLHLLLAPGAAALARVRRALLATSLLFSVPTVVLGVLAQATPLRARLFAVNTAWDRVQLTVFFVQETALSLLYIFETRAHLRSSSRLLLASRARFYAEEEDDDPTRRMLYRLAAANAAVVALDIGLLAVQYAGRFYLQGALKPAVYGLKLKLEFAVLNQLVESEQEQEQEQEQEEEVLLVVVVAVEIRPDSPATAPGQRRRPVWVVVVALRRRRRRRWPRADIGGTARARSLRWSRWIAGRCLFR
ncbi:integral membrane protein [Xylariomycetidae sp. FL0641]|nr:integral membrane protein [Xylariomycetidae sp. FL0641]